MCKLWDMNGKNVHCVYTWIFHNICNNNHLWNIYGFLEVYLLVNIFCRLMKHYWKNDQVRDIFSQLQSATSKHEFILVQINDQKWFINNLGSSVYEKKGLSMDCEHVWPMSVGVVQVIMSENDILCWNLK